MNNVETESHHRDVSGGRLRPAVFGAMDGLVTNASLIAGVGNIYASEALFRAGISPRRAARKLSPGGAKKLLAAIRTVMQEAIDCGSTIPLNFSGGKKTDGLFYFGRAAGAADYYTERLRVYDRAGQPCENCGFPIKRIVQAARSTFFCLHCQK